MSQVNEYGFTVDEVNFINDALGMNDKSARIHFLVNRLFIHSCTKKIPLQGGYDYSQLSGNLATVFIDYLAIYCEGIEKSDFLNGREVSFSYESYEKLCLFISNKIHIIELVCKKNNGNRYFLYRNIDSTYWVCTIPFIKDINNVVFKQWTSRQLSREFGISRMAPNKLRYESLFSYDFVDYLINDPELPPKKVITMNDMRILHQYYPDLFKEKEHLLK